MRPLAPRTASDRRLRALREGAIEGSLRLSAIAAVAALMLIIVFLFREAWSIVGNPEARAEAGLHNLFGVASWQPVSEVPKYGLLPLFVGTIKVVVVAMLFATPLGVLAALFSSEFAAPRFREMLKPAIEILAGIPSVVMGFFALMVLATWVQKATGAPFRLNALSAGIALGLGVLPTIFTVAEDALRAVPRSYREASLGLGATPWQTAWNVALPAASAGVAAGVLLGLARAIGETMIVLMASGNAPITSASPLDSARTFSATIAAELAEVVVGSPHYAALFFLGAVLFTVTFAINVLAGLLTERLRRQLAGS